MSLATLKRKTAHKYNNNSVQSQFSLNGTHRNQGYVGQTSLSRTILRSPANGPERRGHGTCCGSYKDNPIVTSSVCSQNDNRVVKSSVLGTKGMLQKRTQWSRRPSPYSSVKSNTGNNLNNQSDYILSKGRKELEAIKSCYDISLNSTKCYNGIIPPKNYPIVPITQGERIFKITEDCSLLDISFAKTNEHNNSGRPIRIC